MLSRLIPKTYHFRRFLSLSSKPYLCAQQHFPYSPNVPYFAPIPKYFSTNSSDNNNNNNGKNSFSPRDWKDFGESEEKFDAFFAEESESLVGMNDAGEESTRAPAGNEDQWWLQEKGDNEDEDSIFKGVDKDTEEKVDDFTGKIGMGGEDTKQQWWLAGKGLDNEDEDSIFKGIDRETEEKGDDFAGHIGTGAEDITPWSLKDEEGKDDLFNFQEDESQVGEFSVVESEKSEDAVKLEKEEQELTAILKGPNRAFGDMIAASGITDEMLDSLIALKDFEGVEGLPPLSVIEEMRYEKSTRKSSRAEIERLKQEEAAKARVREVDEKGRAYGTGRRKCSIARVWVQPGSGKFMVNDKEFDVYFPMLEHRAALLRPFSETKTLGLWDVNCTVKGGGVSGQVGAIRLGISKALQNWEPDLRPTLRNAGFLTRDSRVVERKKPGKAKARKSFQWVKR